MAGPEGRPNPDPEKPTPKEPLQPSSGSPGSGTTRRGNPLPPVSDN